MLLMSLADLLYQMNSSKELCYYICMLYCMTPVYAWTDPLSILCSIIAQLRVVSGIHMSWQRQKLQALGNNMLLFHSIVHLTEKVEASISNDIIPACEASCDVVCAWCGGFV